MIVFVDENITPRLVRLFELAAPVKGTPHLFYDPTRKPFHLGMKDVDWIPLLHAQKSTMHPEIVVFSGDGRILRSPVESQTLKQCNFNFVLVSPGLFTSAWDNQAWRYLKAWQKLQLDIVARPASAIYKLGLGNESAVYHCDTASL